MKIYICKNHFSPFYTLTLEEIMAKDDENKEDIIYLYQHENAVIIGRNQNAYKEVRFDILEKENIELYRRLSGGGAVYHDLGNFNFSFITTNKSQRSYQKFLEPVLEFLKLQGLDAQFKGRNDLVVNDCKFSGNAQFIYKDKIVHHGTILYNANLSKLASVLNPSKIKMESKGIKSARQRVINLSDVLEQKIPTSEFIWKFALFLKEKYHAEIVEIPEKYIKKIPEVQKIRSSKEWVLGKNPEFSFFSEKKLDGGILGINANVKENKITQIKFEGDFLTLLGTEYIEKLLINQDFEKANIRKILLMVENLENYFGQISVNEIIDIMFGE